MARLFHNHPLLRSIKVVWMIHLAAAMFVGCGAGVKTVSNASVTITAPPSLRAGQTYQFSASLNGLVTSTGIAWSVQPSGTGNILPDGLYTAPAELNAPTAATVQAEFSGNNPVVSTTTVQLLPALPVITASTQDVIAPGSVNFQIGGSNFLPQTTAFLNGNPVTFNYVSASTATITGVLHSGASQASLVLQNPNDPEKSMPFSIAVLQSDGPVSTVPISLVDLAGCANPNTGSSTGNWGVGSDPVFINLNYGTQLIGTPNYSSNTIFWISRETGPGQSVLMTGAFTNAMKRVRVSVIPPGTIDWQSVVQQSTTVVPTTQQGTTGLSFIIPAQFPAGIYGFEIDDPSAPPILALANVPSMNWIVGVPSTTDSNSALQHKVHDCGVEPGGILRIFGKNFLPSSQIILQGLNGTNYPLAPTKVDTNSIEADVPSTLAPGTYNVWVGSVPWSVSSSPASQITIFPAPPLAVDYATCPSLVGDGKTDNTALLQSCLDDNAPAAGSNHLVYITIPAGIFVLTGGVTPHSYEVLVGSSPASTQFLGQPGAAPPLAWFTVPQYFGLTDLSLKAPAAPYLLTSSDSKTGSPLTSGHLFVNNIDFESSDVQQGSNQMFLLSGPDIQVYNSVFVSSFFVCFGDGSIISGNRFITDWEAPGGFENSQNAIFENNATYAQNPLGEGTDSSSGGSGWSISRAFNAFGPSALSQDIYFGYNTFENMGTRDQQIITTDGGAGAYLGPIASSTSSNLVLADDPDWIWTGTTNPQASSIAIISGTGVGQYSLLKSYSGRTINLVTPWTVIPDSTSVVLISAYQRNLTIAHNEFSNTLGTTINLGDNALESVIEDNILTNSGDGILIWAYGPYGGPAAFNSVMNTDVLRNTIAVGAGNLITPSVDNNLGGVGIFDGYGCIVSGLLIRDNVVPHMQTIFSTNGANGISATLIEQNQANWYPAGVSTPGFLAQDNTSQ